MTLTIDTKAKTIKIKDAILLEDFLQTLYNLNINYEDYTLIPNEVAQTHTPPFYYGSTIAPLTNPVNPLNPYTITSTSVNVIASLT